MFALIQRNRNSSVGVVLLLGLTFMLGLWLGPMLQMAFSFSNGGQIVSLAAGGTGTIFLVLASIGANAKRDYWILTRILWLSGTELGKNRLGDVDSMQRFIYIHGTNEENLLGTSEIFCGITLQLCISVKKCDSFSLKPINTFCFFSTNFTQTACNLDLNLKDMKL